MKLYWMRNRVLAYNKPVRWCPVQRRPQFMTDHELCMLCLTEQERPKGKAKCFCHDRRKGVHHWLAIIYGNPNPDDEKVLSEHGIEMEEVK
jgi:hypothetical protein